MFVCLDVQYRDPDATVGVLYFRTWADGVSAGELACAVTGVAPYEPGAFFKRELPCLLAGLKAGGRDVELVVIDGYVWLDHALRPGLGAHLYEALDRQTPVIGVSKTLFHGDGFSARVLRPGSKLPLYVTAVGVGQEDAARHVEQMHGEHRIPTLLKRVDRLARGDVG